MGNNDDLSEQPELLPQRNWNRATVSADTLEFVSGLAYLVSMYVSHVNIASGRTRIINLLADGQGRHMVPKATSIRQLCHTPYAVSNNVRNHTIQ